MKRFMTALIISLLFLSPVYACEGVPGANCADETQAYFAADESVTYTASNDGSTFLAGNVVSYKGTNDGILFAAGNNVNTTGNVEYGLLAGNNVDIFGNIKRDLFVAGNMVHVESNVSRDAFLVGSHVIISGTIDRNIVVIGEEVTIDKASIKGNVRVFTEKLVVNDSAKIGGTLLYNSKEAAISSKAQIKEVVATDHVFVNHQNYAITFVTSKLLSYASVLVVFVVLALAIPSSLTKVGEEKANFLQIVTYIGYALLFVILVPVAAVMLMMLGIGLPLALIVIGLYILTLYISVIYAGYYIGKRIFDSKGKDHNTLLEGLVGISILYLLYLIPHIGAILMLLAHLCGIGIIIFKFKK